ncbi:MAG: hypothetical protein E7399_04670 [Ruminococcaceae bacterium]|nr:hypothetical protein [Oscillospiraceae bacterium]
MKFKIIGILLFLLILPLPCFGEMDPVLEEQYRTSGGQTIEEYYHRELKKDLSTLLPDFSPKKTIEEFITGQVSFTPASLFRWLTTLLWGKLKTCAASFGLLLLLIVLSSMTGQLNVLGEEGGNAAVMVCSAVMCAVVAELFDVSVRQSREAVASMSDFVTILTPVMATLLAGSGQFTGASLLHPVLYGAATFSVNTINQLIIPVIYGCFLLCVANSLAEGNQLDGFIGLLKNSMKWILTAILTIFSGLTAVYSITGQNVDVMLSKTTRFAVGNFVPIVGGMLSESVELVLSFSSVLRRGVGLGGMVILLLIFAHVAVSLTIQLWMFRIGAAFAVPLGSPALGKLLSDTALCVGMMLASLCVCAVLFCIILIMMITIGGGGII